MRVSFSAAATLVTATLVFGLSPRVIAAPILYGGLGGHSITSGPEASANDGSLVVVDQATGAVSIVGHPAGVARISGLAFDSFGALFGATQVAGGFPPPPGASGSSNLIRLDPSTGALLSSVSITAGGTPISIADLSVQPGTDALFGIRSPNDGLGGQGRLYTINKTTGVSTLVGDTGLFFGTIAFAPNGTLYLAGESLGLMGPTGSVFNTINPSNAQTLTTVPTPDFYGALTVRPDGVIFGGTGDLHQLFTINPATGSATLLGDTGLTFIGDLDFRPVPEPGSFALFGLGALGMIGWRTLRHAGRRS